MFASRKILSRNLPILFSVFLAALMVVLAPVSFDSGVAYVNIAHAGWLWDQFVDIALYIPAFFVGIAGMIMAVAGVLFNEALTYTIVDFSKTFGLFDDGVNAAWGGFRDIANIVMISMFVFVAFNIILGLTTYGTKKFVVTILIVSVLINFSLFFTKAAVDVSNVLAIL